MSERSQIENRPIQTESDGNRAFRLGFASVAALKRYEAGEARFAKYKARNAANTVQTEQRRSDRFLADGQAGVPITKLRMWNAQNGIGQVNPAARTQSDIEREAVATVLYRRIMAGKISPPKDGHVTADIAEFLGLVGCNDIYDGFLYLLSDKAREKFAEKK